MIYLPMPVDYNKIRYWKQHAKTACSRQGTPLIMRYKSGCDTDSSGSETSFSAVGRRRISAALTTCLYMNERCRMDAFASLKGFSRYFASCPRDFGLFVIIEVKHSTFNPWIKPYFQCAWVVEKKKIKSWNLSPRRHQYNSTPPRRRPRSFGVVYWARCHVPISKPFPSFLLIKNDILCLNTRPHLPRR